jgi:serine/tyrosine/threonine adenylyltransferase
MEAYDPATVFSSIDHGGRYAYGNQPGIARWNLARLAEALLPLLAGSVEDEAAMKRAAEQAMEVIDAFPGWHADSLREGRRAKLGLGDSVEDAVVDALAEDFLSLLHAQGVDFTLAWRRLADAAAGDESPLRALFTEPAALDGWTARWRSCLRGDGDAARMRRANPWIIPRNHRVEEVLAAASDDADLAPFERLLAALLRPFDDGPELAPYAEPAPADVTAAYRTFCGT